LTTVDNVLDKITVNGQSIPLSGDVGNWPALKNIPATIAEGDVVAITGTNQGGPAGIIATINYTVGGKQYQISTSSVWSCDGQDPWLQGWNGVGPWGNIGGINAAAEWIWTKVGLSVLTTTCQVKIPYAPVNPNASIMVTIDNIIDQITINGKALALSGAVGDWTVVKNIPAHIETGDVVAIRGTNTGGPAGILATIVVNGQSATSTGSQWSCDGQAPWLQGANGVGPWGNKGGIDAGAQWIWSKVGLSVISTTCQVKIPEIPNASIIVTVDNNLDQITVNGNPIPLSGALLDWTTQKNIPATLCAGDVVAIKGTNTGGPAGIIASITYTLNGKQYLLSTSSVWSCDGQDPWLQGWNGVGPWGNRSGIDASAEWIWSKVGLSVVTTTCQVTIPYPPVNPNASIAVTVDNIIDQITINGKALALSGAIGDWTVVKTMPAHIEPGDVVTIRGTNTGGPAGILATITYQDGQASKTISTGGQWSCDGQDSWLQGANGVGPWGNKAGIAGDAQWIWSKVGLSVISTTCQVKIPGQRRRRWCGKNN